MTDIIIQLLDNLLIRMTAQSVTVSEYTNRNMQRAIQNDIGSRTNDIRCQIINNNNTQQCRALLEIVSFAYAEGSLINVICLDIVCNKTTSRHRSPNNSMEYK